MAGSRSPARSRCVLTLRLLPEPWQIDIIEKRFRLMEELRSELIRKMNARYDALAATPAFQENKEQIRIVCANIYDNVEGDAPKLQVPRSALDARLRQLYDQRNQILKEAGFTKYGFDAEMLSLQKKYKDHIATQVASAAAADVWRAFYGFFYRGNHQVQEKPQGSLRSMANKTPGVSMKYENGIFYWNGGKSSYAKNLAIRVEAPATDYERGMLKKRICLYRVIRNWSKAGFQYSLQITLEGTPVLKKGHSIGAGAVGIYIDRETATVCTSSHVYTFSIPPFMDKGIWDKILETQEKMRSSRRTTNPDNYNRDGTVKVKADLTWVESNNYKKLHEKQKYLRRKAYERNRYDNQRVANFLLSLGDEFYINANYNQLLTTRKSPPYFLAYLDTKLHSAGKIGLQKIPKSSLEYDVLPDSSISPESYKAFLLKTSRDAVYGPERGFLREGYTEYLEYAKRAQSVDILRFVVYNNRTIKKIML